MNITKNEMAQIAIEFMVHDFQENKQTSFLVRKLTRKPAR